MEKKHLSFKRKLLIYCSVWLGVIIISCAVMWNMMVQYERAQSYYAMDAFIDNISPATFEAALTDALGGKTSELTPPAAAAKEIFDRTAGKLEYLKLAREYTYEKPVYLISCGDERLLKVTFRQAQKTGFLGLYGYETEKTEFVDENYLTLHTLNIIAPENASVYVGDKLLTKAELSDDCAFSVFGSSEDFKCYTAENLIYMPSLRGVLNGEVLDGFGEWNVVFDYREKKLKTLSIKAPSSASVRIDKKPLSRLYAVSEETASDMFENTVEMTVYSVPAVAEFSSVSASLDGALLSAVQNAENSFEFMPKTLSYTVSLPTDAVLFANGKEVAADFTEEVFLSDFAELKEPPMAKKYAFSDIFALPEFSAARGGEALFPVKDGEGIAFSSSPSSELEEAYKTIAVDFVKSYLNYTTKGYVNTKNNLNAVLSKVMSGSPLYRSLESSYIGYIYIAPQTMTLHSIEASEFVPFSDDVFTCRVTYSASLKNFTGTVFDEHTQRITFVRTQNGFLPAVLTFN